MPKIAANSALSLLMFLGPAAMAAEQTGAEQQLPAVAAAEIATSSAAAVQAAVRKPPRYSLEILSALKHLSALLSKNSLVDQKGLDAVVREMIALDARVTDLLGPDIIKQLEEQEKEIADKARIAAAKADLRKMRALLMGYYSDADNSYPATPAELVPKDIAAVPELELPRHARTAAITLTGDAGPDPAKAVADTGGWLYFNDPKSANFGMLVLDCSHKDGEGVELYKY